MFERLTLSAHAYRHTRLRHGYGEGDFGTLQRFGSLLDNDRHVRSAEALRRGAFSLSSQRRMRRVCGYGAACNRNRSRSAPASTNITITGTIAGRAAMPMPTRGTNAAIPVQTTSMTTAKLTS